MPDRARPSKRADPPRVLVAGYYGYGNVGDEAILHSLLRDLGSALPRAEFQVLYGDAAPPARLTAAADDMEPPPNRVLYLPRLQIPAILKAMRVADVLLLGGGTLIQDVTSVRSLAYYLGLIWAARANGLRVAFYGGGLGPLTTRAGRRMAAMVLPKVDLLALRDRRSIETATALGVPASRILLTADPAFSHASEAGDEHSARGASMALGAAALDEAAVPIERRGSLLGLALRPPLSPADRDAVIAGVRSAVAASGLFPLLVPFHPGQDLPLLAEIGGRLGTPHAVLRSATDPAQLQAVVAACQVMLAMRLHGAIFAVAAGVPCLAMAYDPKVEALADDVPALQYVDYPCVDAAQLADRLLALAAGREAVRADLRRSAAALSLRAAANATAVAGLLGGPQGVGE